MSALFSFLDQINGWLWNGPLLVLLFVTGIGLTVQLRGFQFRYLISAFRALTHDQSQSKGDISHLQSLMTTLAGAIGTGSIVGVATAITVGGVGALFWMWLTALLGMATKYAESLLAVKYRTFDAKGEVLGGPMEYMNRGLGWRRCATLFAFLGIAATFLGIGNLVQVNAIVESSHAVFGVEPWLTGTLVLAITAMVVLGGIRAIGTVATFLVPLMGSLYLGAGAIVLAAHWHLLPQAMMEIFQAAFSGQAALGAFSGASVTAAMQMGISNSIFSNEAGLGTPTIAAAAAKTDSPAKQGMITMTGALLTTFVVCTMSGLVIAVSGLLGTTDANGALLNGSPLAIAAFEQTLSGGRYIVTISLLLFAYSTMLAWSYYGEKCFEYLFGVRWVALYRLCYLAMIIPGALLPLDAVWTLGNLANGLLVLPNLLALLCLRKVIKEETDLFIAQERRPRWAPLPAEQH